MLHWRCFMKRCLPIFLGMLIMSVAAMANAQVVTSYYSPYTTYYAPAVVPSTTASVVTGSPMPTTVTSYYPGAVTSFYQPVTTFYSPVTTYYAPATVYSPVVAAPVYSYGYPVYYRRGLFGRIIVR